MSKIEVEKPPNPPINLSKKNIQIIAMSMFIIFIQNVAKQKNVFVSISNIQTKKYFKTIDVRFFDSKLKDFYDTDDVIQMNRDVYYQNVFLFVKRIKNAITLHETEIVRVNISSYLRNIAQI